MTIAPPGVTGPLGNRVRELLPDTGRLGELLSRR